MKVVADLCIVPMGVGPSVSPYVREIKAIIDNAYGGAKTLLTERLDELHRLARGLLEYETLSGDDIRTVLRGEPVIRKVVDEPATEGRRASVPSAGRPVAPPPTGGLGPAPQPG